MSSVPVSLHGPRLPLACRLAIRQAYGPPAGQGRLTAQPVDVLFDKGAGEAGVLADLQPEAGRLGVWRPGEHAGRGFDRPGRLRPGAQFNDTGGVIAFQAFVDGANTQPVAAVGQGAEACRWAC
jgi:hypothetical protein